MPRFRKNRVAKPESVASKLTNSNAKSAASKTLLRTKNDLRGLRKNSKLNNKCSRKVKWLDYQIVANLRLQQVASVPFVSVLCANQHVKTMILAN